MARVLGYGGVANTNGTRDFSGKEEAAADETAYYLTVGRRQNEKRSRSGYPLRVGAAALMALLRMV